MSELYELPKGWKYEAIENLAEILDSKRIPISQKDRISGIYPYYGASGILDYINDYIFDEKLLLIGEDGARWGANENTSFIADGKYWVNNHAHILRPNRNLCIDEFIVYYLNFIDLLDYITGATVKKLNQQKLKSIKILLPPLSEQQRIIKKLDLLFEKIDKAISLHQKNIDEAEAFMGSVLKEVFEGLEEKYGSVKLQNLYEFKNGINFSKNDKDETGVNGVKTIDVMNMYSNGLYVDDSKLYSVTKNIANDYILMDNDILFVRSSVKEEGVGWTSIYKDKNIKTTYCGFIIRGRPLNNNISKDYVTYLLRSNKLRRLIILNSSKATITNINQSNLGNIELPLPPLHIQQKTAQYLDDISEKIERVKTIQKEKMANLKALKASILNKAFRGEI